MRTFISIIIAILFVNISSAQLRYKLEESRTIDGKNVKIVWGGVYNKNKWHSWMTNIKVYNPLPYPVLCKVKYRRCLVKIISISNSLDTNRCSEEAVIYKYIDAKAYGKELFDYMYDELPYLKPIMNLNGGFDILDFEVEY